MHIKHKLLILIVFVSVLNAYSQVTQSNSKKYKLPNIDLSHWSVTIPEGKPTIINPPEILNYAKNEVIKPYMYNDSINGAIVFYAYPSDATTSNSKYSRSELREQIVSGNNNVNWTFKQGGQIKGELQVAEISKDENGKYHRVMVMQIHGRLTDNQKNRIGQKDNNAPPILKIYWDNGRIRVKTKQLKNLNASTIEMLHKEAWTDDSGFTFKEKVEHNKFTLEIKVAEGKIIVILNNNESKVYANEHLKKWGIFENYFKAGNYLITRDENAFAKIKYYSLHVKH